jgi:hypothetical protein
LNEHCHEKHDILENIDIFIDAHRGRGTGGTSCTPSKDFKKLDHTNAVQHKNRGRPSQIFSQSQVPPSEEFEKDCSSMEELQIQNHLKLEPAYYSHAQKR